MKRSPGDMKGGPGGRGSDGRGTEGPGSQGFGSDDDSDRTES
jgi:hypothetical protein